MNSRVKFNGNNIPFPKQDQQKSSYDFSGTYSVARAIASYHYNRLPQPIRLIFNIPVTVVETTWERLFPSILFTEGAKVFRENFGFSWDKLANNILLSGMFFCIASKFYVNPWFEEEYVGIDAYFFKMDDKTISDEEFYMGFYNALWSFTKVCIVHVVLEILNSIFQSLLNRIITFNKQFNFILEWVSNFSAYGLKTGNAFSNVKDDKEKLNLNPVNLFADIKRQTGILSLWNDRLSTLASFYTTCRALFGSSSSISFPSPLGIINLPLIFVLSVAYSLSYNALLSFFEGPLQRFLQKMNQLSDKIVSQITNIHNNAELITFLEGEKFESKKLLKLLNQERRETIKFDFVNSGKQFVESYTGSFQWLFPFLASVDSVRKGIMRKEEVGLTFGHYNNINRFLTWYTTTSDLRREIEEGVRRHELYAEFRQSWNQLRADAESKVIDSEEIGFSGSIFADKKRDTLLAKGQFVLEPGSITHIDAPSGCGKTTLFRIFCRIWNVFDGKCSLPKEKTIFLPSQTYILGSDEPLIQTVCYPNELEDNKNTLLVKLWLQQLGLPAHVYNNLSKLSLHNNKIMNAEIVNNFQISLSDGERKRIIFCNMLLKLYTQDIQFLIMDEPFKGIDPKKQKVMVKFLRLVQKKSQCTILFSNHEDNHGLNTHRLKVDSETKKYYLSQV